MLVEEMIVQLTDYPGHVYGRIEKVQESMAMVYVISKKEYVWYPIAYLETLPVVGIAS